MSARTSSTGSCGGPEARWGFSKGWRYLHPHPQPHTCETHLLGMCAGIKNRSESAFAFKQAQGGVGVGVEGMGS